MKKLEVKTNADTIKYCNACNKPAEGKIYDIKIGCMVNSLCADCLSELIGKSVVVLASDK